MAKKITNAPASEHIKKFVKLLEKLRLNHNAFTAFSDFCELAAIAISQAVNFDDEREENYLRVIHKYTHDESEIFPEMLACIVNEMEPAEGKIPRYYDVLGELFGELELTDSWKGQFFTPQVVSDMMGLMTVGECEEAVKEKGYVSVLEPCIGGGANVIGVVNAMFQKGYNPCKQLLVKGYDLDARCIHMSYIQLSLMGIPAILQQRNSLTGQTYGDFWVTPMFVFEDWAGYQEVVTIVDKLCGLDDDTPAPPKLGQLSLF